jgi:hypothetical protein
MEEDSILQTQDCIQWIVSDFRKKSLMQPVGTVLREHTRRHALSKQDNACKSLAQLLTTRINSNIYTHMKRNDGGLKTKLKYMKQIDG